MSLFKKLANACRAFNGEVDISVKERREEDNRKFEKEWNEHNCWHCKHLRWGKSDEDRPYVEEYVCVASGYHMLGPHKEPLNKGNNYCSDFEKKRAD